jgi:hypothetical protein
LPQPSSRGLARGNIIKKNTFPAQVDYMLLITFNIIISKRFLLVMFIIFKICFAIYGKSIYWLENCIINFTLEVKYDNNYLYLSGGFCCFYLHGVISNEIRTHGMGG